MFKSDSAGFFHFRVDDFGDLAGEFCAVAFQVQLEIETKAAGVPVCRADHSPSAVDEEEF